MQGKKHLTSGTLARLLAILLLAGCGVGGTASAQLSPTPSAPPSPMATTVASATSTTQPQGDWQIYTDTTYGFHLEVPAILPTSFPPSGSEGHYVLWQYDFSTGTPPADQALFAQVQVMLFASTAGTYPCTKGTPITIGSGVTAYEDDSLDAPTPTPGTGAQGLRGLDVNFVVGGVYFHVELDGNPPKDTFRTRYGAIWQHILNSFVLGPAVPTGNPCG